NTAAADTMSGCIAPSSLLAGGATAGGEPIVGPRVPTAARARVVDVAAARAVDGGVVLHAVARTPVCRVDQNAVARARGHEVAVDDVALEILAGQDNPTDPDEVLPDHGVLDAARVAPERDPRVIDGVALDSAMVATEQSDAATENAVIAHRACAIGVERETRDRRDQVPLDNGVRRTVRAHRDAGRGRRFEDEPQHLHAGGTSDRNRVACGCGDHRGKELVMRLEPEPGLGNDNDLLVVNTREHLD